MLEHLPGFKVINDEITHEYLVKTETYSQSSLHQEKVAQVLLSNLPPLDIVSLSIPTRYDQPPN